MLPPCLLGVASLTFVAADVAAVVVVEVPGPLFVVL